MEEEVKKKTSPMLIVGLVLLCAGLLVGGFWLGTKFYDWENPEEESVSSEESEQTRVGYDKITPTANGVYKRLSFVLDNTFEQHRENNVMGIADALSINGSIFKTERYKYEFAFQFGKVYEYAKYLDDDVTKETGAYWLTKADYEKVYKRVYGSDVESLNKYLENNYYKSGIFTGYTSTDEKRFTETKSLNSNNVYYTEASIYNTPYECEQETGETLELVSEDEYCIVHGKKIGRLEIVYTLNNNDYVIKDIALYDLSHSESIKSQYGF